MRVIIEIEDERGLFLLAEAHGEYYYTIMCADENNDDNYFETDNLKEFRTPNALKFTSPLDKFEYILDNFERR